MTFYTGKSADGSDMKEFNGVYVNPDNNDEWSSTPYPGQQKIENLYSDLMQYANGRFTLNDIYEQIQNGTCTLSKSRRDYVLSYYDENGKFKEDETDE